MVYVLNIDGQPLMPTNRHGKVRRLLKSGQAKVVNRCPFTIKLLYESTNHTQPISLGIDAGSKTIGLSATTKDKVLFEANVALRTDIVELIASRKQLRRSRRNRKTRYREARFLNRKREKGWLAPSIISKINAHLVMVAKVNKFLPITNTVAEVASFDIQLIKAKEYGLPLPSGTDYQQGEQLGFWNVREYVLCRDGHKCKCCKGKSKDKILNVHHIESRHTGGDAPNNLVTLCETCHKGYHKGTVKLPDDIKRGIKFDDAAFMGIMRWAFYNKLKETYPNVKLTYGYITKNTRIENGLPKDHYVDARCISGNPLAKPLGVVYQYEKVRCHNRKLHGCTVNKGGYRKSAQNPKTMFGYKMFDKVRYENKEWYVKARKSKGMFLLQSVSTKERIERTYRKLSLPIEHCKNYLCERKVS